MELRHLTYFRRVAESGSISRAASSLHMTQPALSRQVLELETELGYALFERSPKGVSLTLAGSALYAHLDLVFAQLNRIPEVTAAASRGQKLVHIGVPQGLPHDWFLYLLAAAKREHHDITITLHEASSQQQQQLIDDGLIELAVLHLAPPALETATVLTQPIGLALPHDSPLAAHTELTFADLDSLRIMAHRTGAISVDESQLRAETARGGVEIDWVFRQFSEHSSLIAASSEVDAILVTEATASRHAPTWSWIPLRAQDENGERMAVRTSLAWRESAPPTVRRIVRTMTAAATQFWAEPQH